MTHPCRSLGATVLPFLLLLSPACGGDEEEDGAGGCEEIAAEAESLDGTLDGRDDCGRFSMAVGDHAYVNVEVTAPEEECTGTTSGGVVLPYDPIYSNPSNGEPKWTFDVEAMEAGEGELDVTCVDGTRWTGVFEVD